MEISASSYKIILIAPILLFSLSCSNKKKVDPESKRLKVVNRNLIEPEDTYKKAIVLDAQSGDGLAILDTVIFKSGSITLDIKGEDKQGQSFVGIAFNIQDDSTYEAVYFRPFNFKADEEIRRQHGIQYIYHPEFTWNWLRKEKEGQFEAEFTNPPSPSDWFTIKVNVDREQVTVTDARTDETLMKVKRLTTSSSNKIGFWVGNNSKGSFKNLKVE